MATQADYQAALTRATKAEEALAREREEAQVVENALEDYHAALSHVLGFIHEYVEEHGDGSGQSLALVKADIERLHPILCLHDDVVAYGFTLECDVPSGAGEITDEEVLANTCTVCRGLLDEGDEPGSGICSTCLSADETEREADRDAGIDAKDGLL